MNRSGTVVVAIDFGATSIRVVRVDLEERPLRVDVVHRYAHAPVRHADGSLRWDWDRLMNETTRGLELALERGPVASIGVDTWAVDYGLIDAKGELQNAPHSYRSERTANYTDVVERVGARRLYEICGLQVQPFNTIFQLAAHDTDELATAAHLLFLPDLVVHHLTEDVAVERTSAGSSGLYVLTRGDWSDELIDASGAPRTLFGTIVDACTASGTWNGIPVHRVGGHDTASAVAAMPGDVAPSTSFVASGTWLLVGREQDEPDTSVEAQRDNFTNELGVLGGIRFLKNVAGFWLLNECCRSWNVSAESMLAAARQVTSDVPVFDATDVRFLAPLDMEAEIRDAAGLRPSDGRDVVTRCIVESMAATVAAVLQTLGGVTEAVLLGGGANVDLLRERMEVRAGVLVRGGPVEAAAIGNALVQGIALGVFDDLKDARAALVPLPSTTREV